MIQLRLHKLFEYAELYSFVFRIFTLAICTNFKVLFLRNVIKAEFSFTLNDQEEAFECIT